MGYTAVEIHDFVDVAGEDVAYRAVGLVLTPRVSLRQPGQTVREYGESRRPDLENH